MISALALIFWADVMHLDAQVHRMTELIPVDLQLVQSRTLEDVIFQLQSAGYEIEDITRTFLGRLRVVARRDGTRREIIMSRSTGEILSDTVSVIRTTPAGEAGRTESRDANGRIGTPSDNANARANDRGGNSGGAANNNRGSGGSSTSSNRGGDGNNNSNARPGSD